MKKTTTLRAFLAVLTVLFSATNAVLLGDASQNNIFPSAKDTYTILNQDPENPFVLSFGTSMSQTHHTCNTVNPDFERKKLQQIAQKDSNPKAYLSHKDRIAYVLRSLPIITCEKCQITIDPLDLEPITDSELISNIIDELAQNISETQLTLKQCPHCHGNIIELPQKRAIFTDQHKHAMLEQIQMLGVTNQKSCTQHNLPNYRLSIEACDILQDNSTEIDPTKLQAQANFLQSIGNPLLFCHHYANPQAIPDLFEKSEHVQWFANYCSSIISASPHITHICPISQPVAFFNRVTRHNLPPFECSVISSEFLKNITDAQVAACKKMKSVNPHLKVLFSHQWKPMRPKHAFGDPRRILELLVCQVADRMYNGAFINMLQPHQEHFDGIALSVYPAMYFNLWTPEGNNHIAHFSADDSLEAIMQTHKAFPNKDIYIIETGCNTTDPQMKQDFIDMTLHVCKIARDQGVPVKGVYFWGHTNDPLFYTEWNLLPGTTNFAPFDDLNIQNPCASINAAGLYIKEILQA